MKTCSSRTYAHRPTRARAKMQVSDTFPRMLGLRHNRRAAQPCEQLTVKSETVWWHTAWHQRSFCQRLIVRIVQPSPRSASELRPQTSTSPCYAQPRSFLITIPQEV